MSRFLDLPAERLLPAALVLVAALSLISLVLLISLIYMVRRAKALEDKLEAEREEATSVRRLEQDLATFSEFIQYLPEFLFELHTSRELRDIPGVLVKVVTQVFGAEQVVVLIRRRATLNDPKRSQRLIVAALALTEHGLRVGSEIGLGEGQLGYVAEAQRAMDRQDYERETGGRQASGSPALFDVAAPMIAGNALLGVVALSRPRRRHVREKEMLRMIAHMGALAWHNVNSFRHLHLSAEVDELTGIFNKRALNLRLSELVFQARSSDGRVGVFLFDIDHFKNYNDLNGHLAGDKALRTLSQLVRDSVRADDTFGRFGGEEFLLIMPDRTAAQGQIAAEKVRRRVEEHDFDFGDRQPLGRLTISGGVASFPDDGGDAVELLAAADRALYRAKEAGRNCVLRADSTTGAAPLVREHHDPKA